MADAKNLREVGDRVEALVGEIGALADPAVRQKAEELVRLLMELYGAGLARILEIARDQGRSAAGLPEHLAEDELVASLLILHGLHPLATEARVVRALDRVRPYLGSHGGDVQLLGVEDGVVRLRLEGSCHSCPSSTVTLKLAVERAIEEAAPEVLRIEVDGGVQAAPGAGSDGEQVLGEAGGPGGAEWFALPALTEMAAGAIAGLEVRNRKIIVCAVDGALYSYASRCPSCAGALDQGSLAGAILSCAACGHGYNVRRAGQSENGSDLHLEPVPLLVENGAIKIALPGSAGLRREESR